MKTGSRYSDIEALISHADEILPKMQSAYESSLHDQEIAPTLLIMVKDYVGTLRSSLDYLNGKIPGHGQYFPICDTHNDFVNRASGYDAAMQSKLEEYQPYNNNAWLRHLNILNNKNKHVTLVPQKRKETITTKVSSGSGSVQWGPGVTFGGGVSVMGAPIDPLTQLPVPNNFVKTERTIWVDFIFDGSISPDFPDNLSALPFLIESVKHVNQMIPDIESAFR